MKRIGLLLVAFLLLFTAAFAEEEAPEAEEQQAEEQQDERPADIFDIWDFGGESLSWVTSAVPVSDGVVMTSPAALPAVCSAI